jgi:predicted RNA-binding protein associated with RNAse of E/G family
VSPNRTINVRKLNHLGEEVFQYRGDLLERSDTWIKLAATFDLPDFDKEGLSLRTGDRFVEMHYSDRWYNLFAIHDVDSGQLKGWYCNITRPAVIEDGMISADDLALDLLVFPDGTAKVLDEDEFEALDLAEGDRQQALAALSELQRAAEQLEDPFRSNWPD